jgi:hypothetical protein
MNLNPFKNKEVKSPTEGEEFIRMFLDENGIKYITQHDLLNLKDDYKQYRIADFYLPRLKTCIEFNGYWNVSEESKQRYREKMKVYAANNIPCIYLYPENLGILSYVFHKRMIKELKCHDLKFQLFRYKWKRFRGNTRVLNLIIIPIYIIFFVGNIDTGMSMNFIDFIIVLSFIILLAGFYDLVKTFIKYMILNK